MQANGTTQIHAIVIEPSGTPVHDGTTVLFTTNLGTLLPVEARTQNGVATVQFLGNGQSGTATIKALSGGSASEALELSVGAGASGRVSVTANPASVPVAGGTTTISAAVFDASGNPLSGVPVSFSTTAGTFSSVVVNSDASGTARTTLTTNQAASVTATAGSTTSAPVAITVAVRPTVTITVPAGTTPTEGAVTTLSLTVTSPATGGSPIQAVTVDYGDGSSDDLGSISGTISIQHVYGDSGSYRPTVTVVDSTGTSVTASTVIFVQPIMVSITANARPPDSETIRDLHGERQSDRLNDCQLHVDVWRRHDATDDGRLQQRHTTIRSRLRTTRSSDCPNVHATRHRAPRPSEFRRLRYRTVLTASDKRSAFCAIASLSRVCHRARRPARRS